MIAKEEPFTRTRHGGFLVALAAVLALVLAAQTSRAATQEYFDVNGTTSGFGTANGGTYSWDSAFWANRGASGTDANGTFSTSTWVTDGTGFARFFGGTSGDNYTV